MGTREQGVPTVFLCMLANQKAGFGSRDFHVGFPQRDARASQWQRQPWNLTQFLQMRSGT